MPERLRAAVAEHPARSRDDFLKFWVGQTISNLGSSITLLALPLLIYERTGSAVGLSLASVANLLPILLFGLPIGAWVDRVDRKRLMIWTDVGRAAIVATIPLLAARDALPLWWIYAVGFVNSTLTAAFNSAEFAAIPSLVAADDLVEANGRIQASYAAATIAGPVTAGLLAGIISIEAVIAIDALSFLASATSLALIRRSFNSASEPVTTSMRSDVVEGLRFVLGHPVLRAISLMMAMFNFVGAPVMDQLVLFADRRLKTNESGVGLLFAAASVGVVVLSLLAGRLRRRWSFSRVALGALAVHGGLVVAFALNTSFVFALPLMALLMGLGVMFNINTSSLRQAIVPSQLLGRVMSIAMVLATSASPLGSVLGGVAIERTGSVEGVYAGIGIVMVLIALGFSFTALGRAERYLPGGDLEAGSRLRVRVEVAR
jgi:MFS family permease